MLRNFLKEPGADQSNTYAAAAREICICDRMYTVRKRYILNAAVRKIKSIIEFRC
jgi:hypothetical protein